MVIDFTFEKAVNVITTRFTASLPIDSGKPSVITTSYMSQHWPKQAWVICALFHHDWLTQVKMICLRQPLSQACDLNYKRMTSAMTFILVVIRLPILLYFWRITCWLHFIEIGRPLLPLSATASRNWDASFSEGGAIKWQHLTLMAA